jgi:hypothetical protein
MERRWQMTSKAAYTRAALFDGWTETNTKANSTAGRHGVKGLALRLAMVYQALCYQGANTLNTFHGQASISGTVPDDAVCQGHWRTHYLPSCLVVQMAIAVLYTTNHHLLRLAGFARPARFDTSGL